MSATQRRFGAQAVKSRPSRSSGWSAAAPGSVVRGGVVGGHTPAIPTSPISRSTVQRATQMPSRRSCRQIFVPRTIGGLAVYLSTLG